MDQVERRNPAESGLVVLPAADGQRLYRCEGDSLEDAGLVTADHEALVRLSDDAQHVGVVEPAGKRVGVLRIGPAEIAAPAPAADLPRGCLAKAIALKGDRVFVSTDNGRRSPEARLWSRASEERQWTPMATAPELDWDRKWFDELLVDGDRLIAVDDIVMPKFLVVYDLSRPSSPTISATVETRAHTSYEEIFAAALGSRWLAVASAGTNHGYSSSFLSLYGARDLAERFSYSRDLGQFDEAPPPTDPGDLGPCRGLAFAGDVLFVAGENEGVGVLDLTEVDPDDLEAVDVDAFGEAFEPDLPLAYHDVGGFVADVRTAPNVTGCVVILGRDEGPPAWRRFSP